MLFSDFACANEITLLMNNQSESSRPHDKSRPGTTRDTKALLLQNAHNSNTRHLCRALPLVVLVNLLWLSRIFTRHNNSPVFFLPILSLLTLSQACGGFDPWLADVWSGACVSGTLRCVGGGCFDVWEEVRRMSQ